jgi:hypothetical protein
VEIEPPVVVEVREDGAQAVVEPRGLESGLNADLAEPGTGTLGSV